MSKKTLSSIAGDHIALWQLLEETDGLVGPTLETWLKEVETNLATKADSYHFISEALELESNRLRNEAAKLVAAAKALERVNEGMNDRIKITMQQLGTNEIKGNRYRYAISNSTPRLILDEQKLPDEFKKTTIVIEPDKTKIRDALKAGAQIPGAMLEKTVALKTYVNKGDVK